MNDTPVLEAEAPKDPAHPIIGSVKVAIFDNRNMVIGFESSLTKDWHDCGWVLVQNSPDGSVQIGISPLALLFKDAIIPREFINEKAMIITDASSQLESEFMTMRQQVRAIKSGIQLPDSPILNPNNPNQIPKMRRG